MLKGRLGLDMARVPHADRAGLVWLSHGRLESDKGSLRFRQGENGKLESGTYAIPVQGITGILLGPGGSVTQDALRLLARAGTALIACGDNGVRAYSAPPHIPNRTDLARVHAELWASKKKRVAVAREMMKLRFNEEFNHNDLDILRGIEGSRIRASYALHASQIGVTWKGRRFDRSSPSSGDLPNIALNHVVTAIEAAATVATTIVGAIPQLGFIHEDPGPAFVLDITDLYRTTHTIPLAFKAAKKCADDPSLDIERTARRMAGDAIRSDKLVPDMIEKIKHVLGGSK